MVIDFAKNYAHQSTEKPQSAHWDCMLSMMHPVVVYYKCQCRATITDEIIHFTADLRHDAFAIEEFEKKTIQHLKSKQVKMKCIYEYSDNCEAQYKSKIPFRILLKFTIPIMKNYFCEKHGKSVAHGLIGRLSQFLHTVVCMDGEELGDAKALYKFCKENWKEKRLIGACQHYEQKFFLTKNIQRPKDLTADILQGTRQIHSIRSVGVEGVVEIRESSCFYINCRGGQGECTNIHLVLPWQRKKLLGMFM